MALSLDVSKLHTSIASPSIIPTVSDMMLGIISSHGTLLGQLFLESLHFLYSGLTLSAVAVPWQCSVSLGDNKLPLNALHFYPQNEKHTRLLVQS